jgi:putative ABC transport system permease protein
MPAYAQWLIRILRMTLPESVRDGLVGDLEELYPERVASAGGSRAGVWLAGQVVLSSIQYGPRRLREVCNRIRGWTMTGWGGSIRASGRQLLRAPGFAAVVIVLLGVGIGANVTVFSLVDGVLLTPLPYPEPDRIVSVSEDNPEIQISPGWTSLPNFKDWTERARSFESMALFRGRSVSVGTDGDPQYAYGARVSAEFFDVFGIPPLLGRPFTTDETRTDSASVVILSHGLWQTGYGADPAIVGRTVSIDGRPHTVVGVMPRDFNAPGEWIGPGVSMALWRPFPMDSDDQRRNRSYNAVARLSDGTTLAAARVEMTGLHEQLREAFPEPNGDWYAQVFEWTELIVGVTRAPLFLLLGTMVLVLLIACANAASLMTTRIIGRGRELATRVALGAPRGRIIAQVLSEVVTLVGLGGVVGILGAHLALSAIKTLEPGLIPRLASVRLDGSVLLFALAVTSGAALLVGAVAAALATRGDSATRLRGSRGGPSAVGWRVRGSLTVVQFVMSFALLAGAGLLAKSFQNLNRSELGFQPRNVTALTVALSWDRVSTLEDRSVFTRDLLAELERTPGVESAGMINSLPLTGSRQFTQVTIEGLTEGGRQPAMAIRGVSSEYHATMQIALTEGRMFERADMAAPPSTALLNETAARLHWPDRSPIGDRLRVGETGPWLTVIGVVGDVRHDGARQEVLPEVYIPYTLETLTSKSFVARTHASARSSVSPLLRDALRRIDPEQPIREIRSMDDWVSSSTAADRFLAALMSAAALIATLLAGIGLFAALAGVVRERRQEIAIRMTLGARQTGVLGLVARRASVLILPGLAGGLPLALALSGALEGFLFGVEPQSPGVLAGVTGGLLLTAALAAYLPAARAASTDPARVLREE